VSINVGVHDGHKGSVPVSHSLRAFNQLAKANGQPGQAFPEADIAFITERARIPERLAAGDRAAEDAGRKHAVLLRRSAGPARITVFDGGHETDFTTAIRWLETHRK
jgi:hypothetical protein